MFFFIIEQGLKIKKIHRVLKFHQTDWLRPFIELNTIQRTRSTNDFQKNYYKLLNNSVYGKCLESVRNRVDIKLRSKWDGRYGIKSLIASPFFKKRTVFSEKLVAIEMSKSLITLDKPVCVGMAILDISKLCMNRFHYNYIKPKYGVNCELLYTDTDSFIYSISNIDDLYEDMKTDIHMFDTSEYPENNVYKMPRVNKKVLGLMSDECAGQPISEFVGLRSKMYSVRVNNIDVIKKAKGVKNYVLKNTITFQDYLDCIRNNCKISREQNSIRSKLHKVFSISQNKIALSPFDDKRQIMENNIDTLPWGFIKSSEVF